MKKRSLFMTVTGLLSLLVFSDIGPALGEAGAGFKVIKGEGSVCVAGTGAIQFSGSGDLVARADGGQLLVSDESAVLLISGYGFKHVFANGWVLYQGFRGKAVLNGEDMFGQIIGAGVRMKAAGEGVMLLTGKGRYKVPCDDPGAPWAPVGFGGVAVELNDYLVSTEEVQ